MVSGSPTNFSLSQSSDAAGWLDDAARIRASIAHPHLIRTRLQRGGPGVDLVNELCAAPTLAQRVAGCPLSVDDGVAVVADVASAVEALVDHGLAPRELSPESIHLHRTRGAILADGGVPIGLIPRPGVVSPSARGYLSPEELAGEPPDWSSFVYTLGAILRDSVEESRPRPLTRVIQRATADDSEDRYQDPAAFAAAAAGALHGSMRAPRTLAAPAPRAAESPPLAAPALPQLSAPRLPRLSAPRLPRLSAPRVPRLSAPRVPRLSAPRVPRLSVPSLPRLSAPSLPRLSARALRGPAARQVITIAAIVALLRRPSPLAEQLARAIVAGVAAAGALAAVAITGLNEPAGAAPSTIQSSALSLQLPATWRATQPPRGGLVSLAAVVAAGSTDQHAYLVAGLAHDRAQLRRLLHAADAADATRRSVQLGELQVWRWTRVQLAGRTTTLFVGYTSEGPFVATCRRLPDAQPNPCSAPLSTLRLIRPHPVALAAVDRARQQLDREKAKLEKAWIAGRARLAAAPFAFEQAAAAQGLEGTFRRASAAVGRIETSPGTADLRPVVEALADTASGYAQLGAAIVNGDRAGYDVARNEVEAGETRVRSAVGAAAMP